MKFIIFSFNVLVFGIEEISINAITIVNILVLVVALITWNDGYNFIKVVMVIIAISYNLVILLLVTMVISIVPVSVIKLVLHILKE